MGRESAGRSVTLLTDRRLSPDHGELIDEQPSGEQNHEGDGSHGIPCKRNGKGYGVIVPGGRSEKREAMSLRRKMYG